MAKITFPKDGKKVFFPRDAKATAGGQSYRLTPTQIHQQGSQKNKRQRRRKGSKMKATKITVGRVWADGNYGNRKVEVEAEIYDGENVEDRVRRLQGFVEKMVLTASGYREAEQRLEKLRLSRIEIDEELSRISGELQCDDNIPF